MAERADTKSTRFASANVHLRRQRPWHTERLLAGYRERPSDLSSGTVVVDFQGAGARLKQSPAEARTFRFDHRRKEEILASGANLNLRTIDLTNSRKTDQHICKPQHKEVGSS